jgi:hypothetical protein
MAAAAEEKTGFALVLQNILTYRTVKVRARLWGRERQGRRLCCCGVASREGGALLPVAPGCRCWARTLAASQRLTLAHTRSWSKSTTRSS